MQHLDFQTRWLIRFGLNADDWQTDIRARLDELAFSDSTEIKLLLNYLFADLPKLLAKRKDGETAQIAEAFAWTCFSFWQCGSALPAFPENYAAFLRTALRQTPSRRDPAAVVLASLIVGAPNSNQEGDGHCGFNQLKLRHPEVVRDSEKLIHEGRYEDYLKAQEKYDEYETALAVSATFAVDWQRLKALMPNALRSKKLIHRTLIPERNWIRGPGAEFDSDNHRFQALFDLFCWKYYLWAMDEDRPLLLKASVVFTPFGTQIFIPGYLSLDFKRDLNSERLSELHRARGINRQGPGFSIGRQELTEKKRQAQAADKEAKRKGLKGVERYRFISQTIAFLDGGDYRRVRKLLEYK